MRAKMQFFSLALRGVGARREKMSFLVGRGRSDRKNIFSEKKPAGSSFHVVGMQAQARTGRLAVADVEKMLAKVPWLLEEVSL